MERLAADGLNIVGWVATLGIVTVSPAWGTVDPQLVQLKRDPQSELADPFQTQSLARALRAGRRITVRSAARAIRRDFRCVIDGPPVKTAMNAARLRCVSDYGDGIISRSGKAKPERIVPLRFFPIDPPREKQSRRE
jgi:hypothetical protein